MQKKTGYKVPEYIVMVLLVTVLGCSKADSSSRISGESKGTGSVSFSIQWPLRAMTQQSNIPPLVAAIDDNECAKLTVEATMNDAQDNLLASGGPWQCSDHKGTINDIPAGSDRKIVVKAKNNVGHVVYQGERAGIRITAGQNTNIGEIPLNPIPLKIAIITSPPALSSDQVEIAAGDVVYFQGSVSGGSGSYSYQWTFDGGFPSASSYLTPGNIIYNNTGTYPVQFTVIDGQQNVYKTITVIVKKPYYVDEFGNDAYDGSDKGFPVKTIQRAINVAQGTSSTQVVIRITEGTYFENIILDAYESLQGGWNHGFTKLNKAVTWGDSNVTVINGGGSNPCISLNNIEDITIEYLIITNGHYGIPPVGNYEGAGIANKSSSPRISSCIFKNNAGFNGGAISNFDGSHPIIVDCIFDSNTAGQYGAGICNFGSSSPKVINCTFINNSASMRGGGIFSSNSSPIVMNSILWNNTEQNITGGDGSVVISSCDIGGCGGSGSGWDNSLGIDGGGNIDKDPMFVINDYHLQASSPCINTGDPNSALPDFPADDIDGQARPYGGRYDMGADEYYP